jgi:hypothetical protein
MADTQTVPATGTFVWNELATRDSATARSILTQLLGWTAEDMDMGPNGTYTIFKAGEKQVGGCWEMKGEKYEGIPVHWLSYVDVKNADVTAKTAERLGMALKMPPTDIPDVGRFAILAHHATGAFAILEPKRG